MTAVAALKGVFEQASATPRSSAASYVKYLDHFRAVAILQIVVLHAGHALFLRGFAGPLPDSNPVFALTDVLFRNATIYFSLISGVIYARVFSSRPYAPFLRARFRSVGVPYLVVTTIFTALLWYRSGGAADADLGGLIRLVAYNAALGEAWNTLWYIPVILFLYAISPLLFRLVVTPRWRWASVVLVVLPLVVSRTGTELTPSIVIYFLGAYVAGLWIGRDLDAALDRAGKSVGWIAVAGGLASVVLLVLFLNGIESHGVVSIHETLFYVQRLSLGLLTLLALRIWAAKPNAWRDWTLGVTAAASFGIYFLHGPLVRPVAAHVGPLVPAGQPYWALALGVGATFIGGLALSWAVILLARALLGRHSRLVLGA